MMSFKHAICTSIKSSHLKTANDVHRQETRKKTRNGFFKDKFRVHTIFCGLVL